MYDMPLYPAMRPDGDREACVRVPVFGGCGRWGGGRPAAACRYRRVDIENPCRPGEWAEVLLGVDECGNLTVCVKRGPGRDCDCRPECPPEPRRPHRPCPPPPRCDRRGRLYGSW